jgi:hypothetical protein
MTQRSILSYDVKTSGARCQGFVAQFSSGDRGSAGQPDLLDESIGGHGAAPQRTAT